MRVGGMRMKSIEELGRINKIEDNIFISFDLNELECCDEIACGALKLEQPEYILHTLLDQSTNGGTMRYSVPDGFIDVASSESMLEIDEVIVLYEKILDMIDTCEDWFLKPSGLCFEASYVYMNTKHDELKVLYIPEKKNILDVQNIKYLMVSLLEKCKETSGGAIQLQLYKYFYKPKFNIDEFREMLNGFKEMLKVDKEASEPIKTREQEAYVAQMGAKAEMATGFDRNTTQDKEKTFDEEKGQNQESRGYYRPKVYASQLSQEEVEEMVKSIYSGNHASNSLVVGSKTAEEVQEDETSRKNVYNASNTDAVTEEKNNSSLTKKKTLFDNVFSSTKASSTKTKNNTLGHLPTLKSISVHTRYDLPKQIEIQLVGEKFTIGRATRTGEATGADYEFGAEITPISRLHARIEMKEGAYYLQDLGSSNGTFLNGNKIEPHKAYLIEDGDKIAFAIAYSKNSIEYAFIE